MKISARAPGKLVLLGEYAVLDGAPGLVMAVARHARVTIEDRHDDRFELRAPPVLEKPLALRFSGGRLAWPGGMNLALVDAVLASFADHCDLAMVLSGRTLTLDTSDFFADGGDKLGLGSSAALTTASLAALCAAIPETSPPAIDAVMEAHRRLQGGRGSGIDVAASFHGGVLSFRRRPGEPPRVQSLEWPPGLHGCAVWSGRPASTVARLGRLERFRGASPDACRGLLERLGGHAEAGALAFAGGEVAAFLAAAEAFAGTLVEIDRRAELEIFTKVHRELRQTAERCGLLYKTSGAGGGDFGLALSDRIERLDAFTRRVAAGGLALLPLTPWAAGLELQVG